MITLNIGNGPRKFNVRRNTTSEGRCSPGTVFTVQFTRLQVGNKDCCQCCVTYYFCVTHRRGTRVGIGPGFLRTIIALYVTQIYLTKQMSFLWKTQIPSKPCALLRPVPVFINRPPLFKILDPRIRMELLRYSSARGSG